MITTGSATRHAWLDKFIDTPTQAFSELLAGYAMVPPYYRADAPDIARNVFWGLPASSQARVALAPAILDWLDQRRRSTPPEGKSHLQRWVREICDTLEIVSLLEVTDAAAALRSRYILWNEWTSRFVLSTTRDVRAAYWRMLALTQPLLASPDEAHASATLAPLWLDICRQADATLPRHYLGIGLLGLRRLPSSLVGTEMPWISGLAHWAMARNPKAAEFIGEWMALKPLYPRTDARWRGLIGQLLNAEPFRDAGIKAPAWWEGDPAFRPMLRVGYQMRGAALQTPSPEECQVELDRLEGVWDQTEPRIDALLQRYRAFVSATGESHFFVRALHKLGVALIRVDADAQGDRARKAQSMAREGLGWAPNDRHLWSLWRDSLAAEGALEAAEYVGWAAIRRDPGDVGSRSQLATMLAGPIGRPLEAEMLLRDTIAAFPQDPVARNQLAELLIAGGRIADAEAEVDAAFEAQAVAEATYALRARLRSSCGKALEARAVVKAGLAAFPSNQVLRNYARILRAGRSLRLLSAAHAQPTIATRSTDARLLADLLPIDIQWLGRLRRLRLRVESADSVNREAALEEVQQILEEDPSFAYTRLLATRYRLVPQMTDTMPSVAVAVEQALATADRQKLDELAKSHPRLDALILVACAVLGDTQAAYKLSILLATNVPGDEPGAVTFLRERLKPVFDRSTTHTPTEIIVEHTGTVMRFLRDSMDAMLDDHLAA